MSSQAQIQYAVETVSASNAARRDMASDGVVTTSATLTPTLLLGSSVVRVRFSSTVRQGGQAGLILQANGNLDIAALNGISIRTYLNSGSYRENFLLANLVNLTVLKSGATTVVFPVNQDFNQIEVRALGLLNLSFEVDVYEAFATLTTPLPVGLTAFQGEPTSTGVTLTWNTASELNNDHFVVERSADGAAETFQAVGQVQGAGTSNQPRQYQLTDATTGATNYYRLRQVDYDGKESFSAVIVVKAEPREIKLTAYPNPTSESLIITAAPNAVIRLFDQLGRPVLSTETSPSQQRRLDVSQLPAGIYFLRNAATGSSTKFVKAGNQLR